MPKIAYFLGIVISMYHRDHNPPHIHVTYQGFKALIEIRGGGILRGRLPPTALMVVRNWVKQRQPELMANWERARLHETLERVAGPDDDSGA